MVATEAAVGTKSVSQEQAACVCVQVNPTAAITSSVARREGSLGQLTKTYSGQQQQALTRGLENTGVTHCTLCYSLGIWWSIIIYK